MKLRRGDTVRVIAGKDRGKEGVIDRVYAKQNKVLILGINVYKKHVKKSEQFPQGGIVDMPRPIDGSNVMKVSMSVKKVTRIGYIVEGGKKFRVEKKTGERLKHSTAKS